MEKSPENGIMTLPSYGGIMSLSAGTEPGTVASEMIEKMPSMARRPLFSSTTSFRKYSSGESLSLVHGERPSMFAYLRGHRVDGVKSAAKFDLCAVAHEPGT